MKHDSCALVILSRSSLSQDWLHLCDHTLFTIESNRNELIYGILLNKSKHKIQKFNTPCHFISFRSGFSGLSGSGVQSRNASDYKSSQLAG